MRALGAKVTCAVQRLVESLSQIGGNSEECFMGRRTNLDPKGEGDT